MLTTALVIGTIPELVLTGLALRTARGRRLLATGLTYLLLAAGVIAAVCMSVIVVASSANAAPASKIPVPVSLTVHRYSHDTDGDGGSWAWSVGGYKAVVFADAPSVAYDKIDALNVGDMIDIDSAWVPSGVFTVRCITTDPRDCDHNWTAMTLRVGFKYIRVS